MNDKPLPRILSSKGFNLDEELASYEESVLITPTKPSINLYKAAYFSKPDSKVERLNISYNRIFHGM